MFSIGMTELILILVLALIFIGPGKLPEVARFLGRGLREFRRASDEFKRTVDLGEYEKHPPDLLREPGSTEIIGVNTAENSATSVTDEQPMSAATKAAPTGTMDD